MIVVDTNVVAYLLLPGPHTALVDDLLTQQPEWAAPPLWRSEWRNVLAGYLRRGVLNLDQALALQQQAALAFLQAEKEGLLAPEVTAAQRQVVESNVAAALALMGVSMPPPWKPLLLRPPVTLTAISGRLASLPAVLDSLRQQTFRPERVHLHLSPEPHLLDQEAAVDEPLLQEITADGWVRLQWFPNLGPYRKIVPFLQAGAFG